MTGGGRCLSRMKCSIRVLSGTALVLGLVSAGALSLAVATDYWLYTTELVPMAIPSDDTTAEMPSYEDMLTANHSEENIDSQGDFLQGLELTYMIPITMHSGLWRMCIFYEEAEMPTTCYNIAYFAQDWRRVSETDTTNSILRAIRKSAPAVVLSLLLLVISVGISTVGSSKRNSQTIIGAVMYIFSALCLAIGVIFYISAVNDEVSHRKKPNTSDEGFKYSYGWAFFCAGSSFMSSMMAAVTNISLYLRRYPNLEDMVLIIPGLDKHSRLDLAKNASEDPECEVHLQSGSQNPTIIL